MIYRKFYKDSGFIVMDVMLALTCAALFIVLITETSLGAQVVFEKAKQREELLDIYSVGTSTDIESLTRPYGNDFTEKIISVLAFSSAAEALTFIKIDPNPEGYTPNSQPICEPHLSSSYALGSYMYLKNLDEPVDRGNLSDRLIITKIDLPIPITLPLTDFEVHNNLLYISTDSNVANDPDILVIDIADETAPKLLSSINTGPGISALTVIGRRIYAAAASTAAQLHIVYITDPDSQRGGLSIEKKYQLLLPYATATPPMGSSIFVHGNSVYLGTDRWDGDEFSIVDVTIPSLPVHKGGIETGGKVNDILVSDNVAYVASSDEWQFRSVDVADPDHPILTGSINPSGWQRQEGKVLSLFEGALFGGRTSGGFNIIRDHEVFSWSTSSVLVNLGTHHSTDVAGGIYGIVADRSNVFTVSRQITKELQIYSHHLATTTLDVITLPDIPHSLTCDGEYLYVLAQGWPAIYKISFRP